MELFFSDSYDESSLFLMEVPPHLLDYIKNHQGELILKGSEPTILCTKDHHYELKFLETSNTYLVLDSENESTSRKEITLMTTHSLECCEVSPKKFFIYNLLKKNCSLNYDIDSGKNNITEFKSKMSYDMCFTESDLPRSKFDNMLKEMGIFSYDDSKNIMCVFDMKFIFDFCGVILKAISYLNQEEYENYEEIFEIISITESKKYDLCIKNMNKKEKETLLSFLCDLSTEKKNSVKLNVNKAKKFIAKNLFHSNPMSSNDNNTCDFKLVDFISIFSNAINIYLPLSSQMKSMEESQSYLIKTECNDNLFEFYRDYDLRFLIGNCIIYFDKALREPLIKWIEVSELPFSFEERLQYLFSLKDKWTANELKWFFQDLEISNLRDRVNRVTQIVPEPNMFNKEKTVNYLYFKRNPFYKEK